MTPQQRKNIRIFLKRWKTIPPWNVAPRLAYWQRASEESYQIARKPTCGTIACAGGWCALMPEFQEIGIRPNGSWLGEPVKNGISGADLAQYLFGDFYLFDARLQRETGTDHEVVTKRFKALLRRQS